MDQTSQEVQKITARNAASFGFQLANKLAEQLEQDRVPPSQWPVKFPISLKQISKTPEVNGNNKIAKKISEAARIVWKEIRVQALELEKDIKLHPELYEILEGPSEEESGWRKLSIEIEQTAGNIFLTEFTTEDEAMKNVYSRLGARSLKNFMTEFEDDYKNFMHDVRETIRNKKELLPSKRLELICLLNVNTKTARKLLAVNKRKS